MQLKDLQQRFVASLLLEVIDPVLLAHLGDSCAQVGDTFAHLGDPFAQGEHSLAKLGNSWSREKNTDHHLQRLHIYRNNRIETLFNTLKAIYTVSCQWVGENCFRGLAQQFIHHSMSTHFSLNSYGASFPLFLAKNVQALTSNNQAWETSYLSLIDIAKLEWIIHEILIGPDPQSKQFKPSTSKQCKQSKQYNRHAKNSLTITTVNTLAELSPVEQQNLVLKQTENGILIQSKFPIDKIWAAHQEKELPLLDLAEGKVFLYISRNKEFQIKMTRLLKSEWKFLKILEKNKTPKGNCNSLTLKRLSHYARNSKEQEAILQALASCYKKGYINLDRAV